MEMAALRIQAGDSGGLTRTGLQEVGREGKNSFMKSSWSHHHPAYCMAIIPQMCNLLEYFCDQELQHRVESLAAFAERYVDKPRPTRGTATPSS